MKTKLLSSRQQTFAAIAIVSLSVIAKAAAIDALLLQDTYVDNGTSGKPVPNNTNYGAGGDLRVFKGAGRTGRSFLKFSTATLPPGTSATDITQARVRLWINSESTLPGSVTMTPVTTPWDELVLKDSTTPSLTFGVPKVAEMPINSRVNFVSVDVTDWVKAWVSGTLPNEGFMIEASASTAYLNLAFDSKESASTSHEPRLEIALSKIGPAGPQGPQGPSGVPGARGEAGAAGVAGPVGPQGPTGSPGSVGPIGAPGVNGAAWHTGQAGPEVALGAPGDYYLDTLSGDVFAKSEGDAPSWSLVANIKGSAGAAGAAGAPGEAGPVGAQGMTGPQGPAGAPGAGGPQGPAGAKGDPGPAGPQGPAGVWPTRLQPQGDLSMGEFTQGPTP
jgi:hypothetical protein